MRVVEVLVVCASWLGLALASEGLPNERELKNILQEDSVVEDEMLKAAEKEHGPIPIAKGPTRFYFENRNNPKFLLQVKNGIVVTVMKNGEVWDKFVLDQEASGGITASIIKADTQILQVDIDWKTQSFSGEMNQENKIKGIQIEMKFDVKKGAFHLIELKLVDFRVQNEIVEVELYTSTRLGYGVNAPLGLSFGCVKPGMFGPKGNSSSEQFSAGLTFPDMNLQVYKVERGKFGPIWECGNMISIGLWVCMMVTLMFAVICAYGFTMLSNINTMDRFDDPKGKAIYIPHTE